MKIDTHQHHWQYAPAAFPWISPAMTALAQDRLPADVWPAMQACGVTASVLVQARTDATEADFLLQQARTHAHVAGVVAWADLAAPGLARELERWQDEPLLRGFRHILQDEVSVPAWLAQPGVQQALPLLQSRGLVYDVLVFDHQLPDVQGFCAQHDQHWLVLDHLGKPRIRDWWTRPEVASHWRKGLQAVAALPHVMCKISGLVTEADWQAAQARGGLSERDHRAMRACLDDALAAFGPQRLMFGSDWPVCELAAHYDQVHAIVQDWVQDRLSAGEQAAFWAGNAVRCYGLQL